jgi:hypothetical protein
MTAKPPSSKPLPNAETGGELINEAEIEHFLQRQHRGVAQKLTAARNSIASGAIRPLETLPVLLRAARKYAKTDR